MNDEDVNRAFKEIQDHYNETGSSVYDDDVDMNLPDISTVIQVPSLDTPTLLVEMKKVRDNLLEMGQLLHPEDQVARDLHSLLAAIKVELLTRKGGNE